MNSINFDEKYFEDYQKKKYIKRGDKPYLFNYWKRYITRNAMNKTSLLDVGCGLGYFLLRVHNAFKETHGIDCSSFAIEAAKKLSFKTNFKIGSALKLDYGNDTMDVVTAFDVIEHLESPDLFLSEVNRVLKMNGFFIFSTPNPESLGARLKGEQWFGRRDKTHCSIKTISEWRDSLNCAGFSIIKDGTDTFWDTPYFKYIPKRIQWIICIGATWFLVWVFGLFRWKYGENYYCVTKKV